MDGAKTLRDDLSVFEFIAFFAARILETNVVSTLVLHAGLGHQADDQARIHPARKQRTDGHIGDHPPLHRAAQQAVQLVDRILAYQRGERELTGEKIPIG